MPHVVRNDGFQGRAPLSLFRRERTALMLHTIKAGSLSPAIPLHVLGGTRKKRILFPKQATDLLIGHSSSQQHPHGEATSSNEILNRLFIFAHCREWSVRGASE